jgi:UDP-N-acetylmuramoyl-L-alanyl-D-glutamate--2,6-diaminopimelate ligase
LLSTVVNKIGDKDIISTHTTPDPVALNELLNQMVAANKLGIKTGEGFYKYN